MEVILLEKMRNLGDLGDRVQVKPGFGRNFLIPQQKAVFATEKNVAAFETQRAELEKKAKENLAKAEKRAEAINVASISITAIARDEGRLYGSIGVSEIKAAIDEKGLEISKREIVLPEGPFHEVGEFHVEIHLHSDVIANLKVEIVAA